MFLGVSLASESFRNSNPRFNENMKKYIMYVKVHMYICVCYYSHFKFATSEETNIKQLLAIHLPRFIKTIDAMIDSGKLWQQKRDPSTCISHDSHDP
jgi:hypothetical protein